MKTDKPRCLIVIDYQNDFVSGALGNAAAAALEPLLAAKIKEYRASGDDIIFTFDTHGEDYESTQEGRRLPVRHCVLGTFGHELYGEVAQLVLPGDKRFYKPTFGSGELYEYLKTHAYSSIELAGVVSNICVISNAVLAKTAQPETPVIVDARCVASNDEGLNKSALDVMKSFQVEIIGLR